MKLSVIGDDIFADGELVARLCDQGVGASVRGEFIEMLDGYDGDDEKVDTDKVEQALMKVAKGGLIRVSEITGALQCL